MNPSDISHYLGRPSEAELELCCLFPEAAPLVIFDIGACEGEDSLRYARRFPQARVFSFEPLPANQTLIRTNFDRYAVTNAELVPIALSDRAGEATFYVSSGHPQNEFAGKDWNYGNKSSSLLPPTDDKPMYGWIEFRDKITVKCETIDSFCERCRIDRIDFIHMDVQGAEHLVLAGARRMLPRTIALWLEVSDQQLYQGQKLRSEMEQILHELGFRLGFGLQREIEGDQFYVNRRFARTWPYLIGKKTTQLVQGTRRRLGRLKQTWFGTSG